ncbi:MAG: amidohydrolase [Proteobacteria bacterium]|nr:amidohydrolase [Pseudomonadota bacterium]
MLRKGILLTACLAVFGNANVPSVQAQEAKAAPIKPLEQSIYYGGDIITMEGDKPTYVEAVIERDGRIIYAGKKSAAVNKFAGKTIEMDLKGKTMLPGFIDPHGHFMSAVLMVTQVNVASPPMGTVTDIASMIKKLEDFKAEQGIKDGGWIVGWGYDQDLLEEKRHITKLDLDKAFPNNKVLIIHISMHGGVLNSKALEWAGVDENYKSPDGGVVARLPGGNEPAGLLMEMAYIPIFEKLPQPSEDGMMELMEAAQMQYASNGYTHAVEGFTHIKDMNTLKRAAKEKRFFIDIASLPGFTEMDEWLNNPEYPFGEYNNRLKFQGGKFTLDGSPQGLTAYMASPYLVPGPNGEKDWVGSTSIPRDELAKLAKIMVANDIQIMFHANGDGAIEDAIFAIESAGIKADQDKRPIIIHSQFQKPEHLSKYAEIGISPTYFSNHAFYWGDVHIRNVGVKKASFISPIKAANKLGIVSSNHTDFNVTLLDPFFVMWTSMKRETRSGKILGADQRIDAYTALQNITTGPAYQFFEEDRKGMIKKGMLADFVILDKNPLKVTDVDAIREITVLQTIKEGSTIYKRKSVEKLNGYFVKNTLKFEENNDVISGFVNAQKVFDGLFGAGKTMANTVDKIDFAESSVVLIVTKPSKISKKIDVVYSEFNGDELFIKYSIREGNKNTFASSGLYLATIPKGVSKVQFKLKSNDD